MTELATVVRNCDTTTLMLAKSAQLPPPERREFRETPSFRARVAASYREANMRTPMLYAIAAAGLVLFGAVIARAAG